MATEKRRVLVFGASNEGKTSVINLLTGNNAPTNCDAKGCTFESKTVSTEHKGIQYEFTDTAGLNEASGGTVTAADSLKALVSLLKGSKDGYNLLIFVIKAGTILAHHERNYQLFVDIITDRKVPVLLVVTHLENHDSTKWIKDNKETFENNGMHFDNMVGGTFVKSENEKLEAVYQELRENSRMAVWRKIELCSEENPVNFLSQQGGLLKVLRKSWNFLVAVFKLEVKYKWVSGRLRDMLVSLGLTSTDAIEYAAQVEDD
jgi:predicted GTPase